MSDFNIDRADDSQIENYLNNLDKSKDQAEKTVKNLSRILGKK